MNCPKCDGLMKTAVYADIIVDKCSNCGGLWFDEYEQEKLKAISGSEAIDTGDPEVGAKYNRIENIKCPRCAGATPLTHMVDVQQPHIWFESCPMCYGAFFDAGEFADYVQFTLSDLVRRIGLQPRN